jgi:hypothetical protein
MNRQTAKQLAPLLPKVVTMLSAFPDAQGHVSRHIRNIEAFGDGKLILNGNVGYGTHADNLTFADSSGEYAIAPEGLVSVRIDGREFKLNFTQALLAGLIHMDE